MQITAKQLAKIAEKSEGYSVTLISAGTHIDASAIRFARHASGRQKSTVEMILQEGNMQPHSALFEGDQLFEVRD
jgi:hypothetical protein